jgi:hypothetical protein
MNNTATNRLKNHGRQGSTGGNNVLPQLAVIPILLSFDRDKLCKIEAERSYQTFADVDSEMLRNRQLRRAANR